MTLDEAKKLTTGTILYEKGATNADGSPRRWRVNGKVQTWKRDSFRVRIPVKHGMYDYGQIYTKDLPDFCLTEEEAKQ